MANSNKAGGNFGGAIGAAIGLISVAAPIAIELIDKVADKMAVKTDPGIVEELIPVPELCLKEFPLTIEQATSLLESKGFKIIPSPLTVKEARPEFRNYIDTQVISSQPKAKSREKSGTMIIVRYVTQEVISESQKIFDESERQKAEIKRKRIMKRQEQHRQIKQTVDGLGEKIRFRKEHVAEVSEEVEEE